MGKTKSTSFDTLTKWFLSEKQNLVLVLIFGIAYSAVTLIVPISAQSVVNTIAFTTMVQPLVVLTLLVFFFMGFSAALKILQTIAVEWMQRRIFYKITKTVADRVMQMRVESLENFRGSDLMNRFFEVVTLQKGLALILVDGVSIILQALVGMLLLAFYHPFLLLFDILLIASIVTVIFFPFKSLTNTAYKESIQKYKTASWLDDIAANALDSKFLGLSDFYKHRLNQKINQYVQARDNHFKSLLAQITSTLAIQVIASALLLGLGGYLVIKQQLTLGQLVAAEIIVTSVVSGVSKLGKYLETSYDISAAIKKINEISEIDFEKFGNELIHFSDSGIDVSLQNVDYTYQNGSTVFASLNLNINKGQKIGILGENGSGKSTLFDLIAGLREPTQGNVYWDKNNLREFNISEARKDVGFVRSDSVFEGTILDNIRLANNNFSLEDVRAALDQAVLLDEVSTLKNGIMTDLSGSLTPLSPGQKQKLVMSRIFLFQPKLVLIDDALDNVDEESRKTILKNLCSKENKNTLIISSHNAGDLHYCEKIYKIEQGTLVEINR